ncbi:UDP-2,3-diacylglucosamine diphosphatase [Denitromonas ohlonensis]|uniref:UDP-2,3-diacylglucosamine hydrolase n=2 Tax=Denitromonas TaxID=139331 RepID=A0A557RVL1_9RHOO|nr:UDP-2,3-diacylglucosamine diphosphatase [Denitromonas ohlonensis]TVO69192.1 UDP-2,3-diacylglucosamine diphosphatase [Denitromonas ohlonensis]TVO77292.1 UDP-2,3-diacylglucosamine diphosphatase [Denitromonas ohlonensis]TVT78085.1 MAG: UDP-2,3-diacylglucosamine diphosphatase [Denitromonas halophila]
MGTQVDGPVLFIADLHLCAAEAATTRAFEAFLAGPARQAKTLYILGDLFEYWAGDDDLAAPYHRHIADHLTDLTASGTTVIFVAGNRDFLIGADFCAATGIALAIEPVAISLGGRDAVLLHGDVLCTDDHAYQAFRQQVRNPDWQAAFLARPLDERRAIIEGIRAQSEAGKQQKAADIMDVNESAVVSAFQSAECGLMIHGHTHRPATHIHDIENQPCERWVLADWHGSAPYLECLDGVLRRKELRI